MNNKVFIAKGRSLFEHTLYVKCIKPNLKVYIVAMFVVAE
jgi:hypothetical protein